MSHFATFEERLETIIGQWLKLEDEQAKEKINLILPFIQVASQQIALSKISGTASSLETLLGAVHKKYGTLFSQDLAAMGYSDIPPHLMARITEIQQNASADPLSTAERAELLSYDEKYSHAHSKVMFNYGSFMETVFPALTAERQKEIRNNIATLSTIEDPEEFQALLVAINKSFEVENNSALIAKDDLENHALLNQMSNYDQHVADISRKLLNPEQFLKAQEILAAPGGKYHINRGPKTTSNSVEESAKTIGEEESKHGAETSAQDVLKSKGLSMAVGLESEFLLHSAEKRNNDSRFVRNAKLKRIISDLNARRFMQTKYGLTPTVPAITNVNLLMEGPASEPETYLVSGSGGGGGAAGEEYDVRDKEEKIISTRDFLQIKRHLKDAWDRGVIDSLLPTPFLEEEMDEMINNFTEAEIFFFKLFFLDEDTKIHKIDMEGVFDPTKSNDENLQVILPLIRDGRFHEKLLDMIRAHEISIGPHPYEEVIAHKNAALKQMRLAANLEGCYVDDANLQVNLSMMVTEPDGSQSHAFLPRIVPDPETGAKNLCFSQFGANILRIIQESVAKTAHIPGILRDQTQISSAIDRKKYLGDEGRLKGTPYLDINPDLPAFLNHKLLAAKTSTLRISALNADVGVCEIRIIGNNPHFATLDKSQTTSQSALDFASEELLAIIEQDIAEYVSPLSREEILAQHGTLVRVNEDGTIPGLEPSLVTTPIERDSMHDRSRHEPLRKMKPRDSVAIIPYDASQLAPEGPVLTIP